MPTIKPWHTSTTIRWALLSGIMLLFAVGETYLPLWFPVVVGEPITLTNREFWTMAFKSAPILVAFASLAGVIKGRFKADCKIE